MHCNNGLALESVIIMYNDSALIKNIITRYLFVGWLYFQIDQLAVQQNASMSLSYSLPTMEVNMLVHSIEKIVSVLLCSSLMNIVEYV